VARTIVTLTVLFLRTNCEISSVLLCCSGMLLSHTHNVKKSVCFAPRQRSSNLPTTIVPVDVTEYIENRNNHSWSYHTSAGLEKGVPYHFGQAIVIPGNTYQSTYHSYLHHSLITNWMMLRLTLSLAWINVQRLKGK